MSEILPPNGTAGIDPQQPVMVFFSEGIDPTTVDASSLQISDGTGTPLSGSYCFNTTESGKTVVIFEPSGTSAPAAAGGSVASTFALPASDTISIDVGTAITDPAGDALGTSASESFGTGTSTASAASVADLDFEGGSLPTGVVCQGDCGVRTAFGDASPVGTAAAYLSSSESSSTGTGPLVTGTTPALANQTSILTLSQLPVPADATKLVLTFDFVSDEFPEFVGSPFDDHLMISVLGPSGVNAGIATSVNIIGTNTTAGSFPGMPVESLEGTEHTGKRTLEVDVSGLGTPVTAFLLVSDVTDTIYPTVVMVDDVHFE